MLVGTRRKRVRGVTHAVVKSMIETWAWTPLWRPSMPDARRLGPKHQLGHVVAQPVGVGGAVSHDEDMNCSRSQLVLMCEDRSLDCRAIAVPGLRGIERHVR